MPGEGSPARDRSRPGSSQAAWVPLCALASYPGSRSPGIRLAARRGFNRRDGRGRAYHSPGTSRVPAGGPLVDLAAKQQASGGFDRARGRALPAHGRDRDAARRGQVTARSTGGQRQVNGRSAGGRPGVRRRYTPGQWRLAAWASAPIRYP